MKILKRRRSSGFVKYPKDFEKHIIDGTARFRTKCDMLIGPCACGSVHQENDEWVTQMLTDNNAVIEALTLAPEENGIVLIPRYWVRPHGHEQCTALSGVCACGSRHVANERWIVEILQQHITRIVGCAATDLPPIGDVLNGTNEHNVLGGLGGAINGCPCEECHNRRHSARFGRRLNRGQI